MFSMDNGVLSIDIPSFTTRTWVWIILAINVSYGLVTHWRSLPEIRRWNVEHAWTYQLSDWKVTQLFLWRITLSLSVRVLAIIAGLVLSALAFPVTGKFRLSGAVQYGLRWYSPPTLDPSNADTFSEY